MDILKFNKNWNNNFYCDFIGTMRLRDDSRFQVGKTLNAVLLNGDDEVMWRRVKIYSINSFTLDKFSEGMALIDFGMSRDKAIGMLINMYKNHVHDVTKAEFSHIIIGKP